MNNVGQKFDAFHAKNPAVYRTLVRLAREWKSAGRTKLGIASLFERLRWEVSLNTTDPDYKIPNDFKPFYARLIMSKESDLVGLFDLRPSIADEYMSDRLTA